MTQWTDSSDLIWVPVGPLRVVIWPLSTQDSLDEFERVAEGKPWNADGSGQHSGRKREYLASRILSERLIGGAPRRDNYGEPLWPATWAGSLSHKAGHVALVLSRVNPALGVDLERCRIFEYGLQSKIMVDDEMALVRQLESGASAVFSAKESIYKALFPFVKVKFWFDAARLIDVCFADGELVMDYKVTRSLSNQVKEGHGIRVFGRRVVLDGAEYWLTACEG